MKKFLKIFGISFLVILLLLFLAPFLFKDKIKAQIDKTISEQIDATVYYDVNSLSLSLFTNFPNLSVSLENFGVINKEPFKGDTLVSVGKFKAVVDIMSVINSDQIAVKGIYLDKLNASVKVNKLGQANYNITKPDTSKPVAPEKEEASALKIKINEWIISNSNIVYDDKFGKMYAKIENLNHKGSGDIKADIYDLTTETTIDAISYVMDGTTYLNKNKFDAILTLNIDNAKSVYKFKENSIKLNEFILKFDGSVALPDSENTVLDLKFSSPETEFKNLLSLVPSVFLKDFDKIKTDGKLAFEGFSKGTLNTNKNLMPAFGLNLKVDNGFFQYPDLPQPVKNIQIDLNIDSKENEITQMSINLKKGHIEMGSNPIDAKLHVQGLTKMNIDANVKAKINLEEVTKIFPVEGTTLKGIYSLDVTAKGIYDSVTKQMPSISADMGLANGFAKTKDFPSAIENINLTSNVSNATGQLNDTKVNVENMKFTMDDQPFEIKLLFENLDDYTWDVAAKGQVDLTKITKIFPLDDMTLAGIMNVNDFKTKGKMSLLDAQKYSEMPTSGEIGFKNFVYTSKDLPQGFKIDDGLMTFDPKNIHIKKMIGYLGKSDIDITGELSNYLNYTFGDGIITGKMNLISKKFDVNEWMAEDPNAPAPKPEEEVPLQVVEVPKNIDFLMSSKIDQVEYSNYGITNLAGNIIVKEGTVKMENILFNMIGGQFKTSGIYDTKDIKDPKFDFKLDMQNVAFTKAYSTFSTVKALAPIAANIDGLFSTQLNFSGKLQNDMMPIMSSLNGEGQMSTANSKVKAPTLMTKLSDVTKMNDAKDVILNDIKMLFKIENGRVTLKKPIDFMAGGSKFTMTGSQGVDGTVDYFLKTQLPVSTVSKILGSNLTQLTGKKDGDKMDIGFKAIGPGTSPKITPVSGDGKSLDAYAKDQAKAAFDVKKKQTEDSLKNLANKAKSDAEAKLKTQQDSLKKVAEAKIQAEKDKAQKEAEQKVKDKAKEGLKKIGGFK